MLHLRTLIIKRYCFCSARCRHRMGRDIVIAERRRPRPDDYFSDWKQREALAEAMIPLVGKLYRQNNVHAHIYEQPLINISALDIMQAHRLVRQVEGNELSEFETFPVIQALAVMDNLGSAQVDVGHIAVLYEERGKSAGQSVQEFVHAQVKDLIGSAQKPISRPRDVVLFGFGRVGRLVARLLIENTAGGDTLRLRAIVVRGDSRPGDLAKRASLLRRDSVHGAFHGTIRVDEEHQSFVANGNEVQMICADQPEGADYERYGISDAIVVDNTGQWRDRDGLQRHLQQSGVSKVLLTAPGKSDIKNVVHGINHESLREDDQIVSAASCTTNAVALPLKAIHDGFGICHGHLETVHAYTNDQNLIDNYHKADRRGRSAPLNLVLTSTGAAQAVAQVLPEMAGRLTGNAIRVPVPDVSLAILHLHLEKEASVEEINEHMRKVALHSSLRRQIDYTNSPEVVSSDFIGSRHACVYDSQATIAQGRNCILYIWYDNEFGYACQVYRVLEEMAGVSYPMYPKEL